MNFIKDYFVIYNIFGINFAKILKNVTKNENLFPNIFNLQKVSFIDAFQKRGDHAGKKLASTRGDKKTTKNI